MSFLWPEALWLLLVAPLLVLAYRGLLRRRQARAIRFGSLGLVRQAMGQGRSWRRHVPPLLFLAGVLLAIVSLSRPSAVLSLPSLDKTVILAIDVSGSMRAKDVPPDRITAAQTAARQFIDQLPPTTKVGIVTFAASAAVVQPPTVERDDIAAAIERFKLQRGTATGSAILVSLQLLFPDLEFDLQSNNPRKLPSGGSGAGKSGGENRGDGRAPGKADAAKEGKASAKAPDKPAQPGSFTSAAIILVTDGQRNIGPDAVESAKMAAERGVRVFTVGIGTPAGEVLSTQGWSMRVKLDEDTLNKIADITLAKYFPAATPAELKSAYDSLNSRIVLEKRELEVTSLFTAAAALLLLLAGGLSMFWFGRLV
ncbi:MAG TPA: VWA domain-containing protein [Burkholderiaceae bacterium]|nr:VWA domain-containing protein [Burkholderiaceae bacterium]